MWETDAVDESPSPSTSFIKLRKCAKTTLRRLEKIDKEKYSTNTLIAYCDSIHKLLEVAFIQSGKKFSGDETHKDLINYVAEKEVITEEEKTFLQRIRDFRNRIQYEGFTIKINFIIDNEDLINKILEKLKN